VEAWVETCVVAVVVETTFAGAVRRYPAPITKMAITTTIAAI
jgi:hypothetical protein